MKQRFGFCMVAFGLLWAGSATAQTRSLPNITKKITPPNIGQTTQQEEEVLPVVPGLGVVQTSESQLTAVLIEPPKIDYRKGFCTSVSITKFTYQLMCMVKTNESGSSSEAWVFTLRRDGSQPYWAMNGQDFENIKDLIFDYEAGSSEEYRGDTKKYMILFFEKDKAVDAKYCNIMYPTIQISSTGRCRDLVAIRATTTNQFNNTLHWEQK